MNHYLSNYRFGDRLFKSTPKNDTQLIVVIPCYDEPDLNTSLVAIFNCPLPENISVEVIVIINAGENQSSEIKEKNKTTLDLAQKWSIQNSKENLSFLFHLDNSLPKKHAGVGLARKIGMDEAVDRFEQINNKNGIIVCFDADSKCDTNYILEIYNSFENNEKAPGASIYFEHPTSGNEFESEIYEGIIQYELFLRYYHLAFKFTGHPQAFHTIGSSMAVKSWAYQKQSGMNKRKAGEDFYFLQKIIQLGDFIEINSTRVIPSPRTSDRVPFGTGRAMLEHLHGKDLNDCYNFQSFIEVKQFIKLVLEEYDGEKTFGNKFSNSIPIAMQSFLKTLNFEERIEDLLQFGTNKTTFSKRFFNWFNAFRVLKFVHYSRDNFYTNSTLEESCTELFKFLKINSTNRNGQLELLDELRTLDRKA